MLRLNLLSQLYRMRTTIDKQTIVRLMRALKKFYADLYSSEINLERLRTGHFLDNLIFPHISEDQAKLLESPISQLEVDKAISTLQPGKCPGEDGFPVEFFKAMKGKICNLRSRGLIKSFEDSKLPESMYRANIILIAKKTPETQSYAPHIGRLAFLE